MSVPNLAERGRRGVIARGGKPVSDDERSEIIALACQGMTLQAIADQLDRPYSTVSNVAQTSHRYKAYRTSARAGLIAATNAVTSADATPKKRLTPGRKPPRGTRRPCLCCQRPFVSEGSHHRLCGDCRQRGGNPFETPVQVFR